MFRVIGGAVVYGLALYGVVKLFDHRKMEEVIQPGDKQDNHQWRETATDMAADQHGKPSIDQESEPPSLASAPADPA